MLLFPQINYISPSVIHRLPFIEFLAARSKNRELCLSLAMLNALTDALKMPQPGNRRSFPNIFEAHSVKPIDVEQPLS